MKPSSKAARKARIARLFKEYQEEFVAIRLESIEIDRVVIRYAGVPVDILWKDGHLTRGVLSGTYLSEEDYTFLFTLAKELMRAVLEGYKIRAARKGKKTKRKKATKRLAALDGQLSFKL